MNTPPWNRLLHTGRRKTDVEGEDIPSPKQPGQARTELERDFDRILFCTPVRRMADKTQVFPLDRNDSVRNRLTHSHEVSNLARSFGTSLIYDLKLAGDVEESSRDVPALLAAIGLVHDLGNPPFGHQGEAAIQSWFRDHIGYISELNLDDSEHKNLFEDFLRFEGNAQGFRLVTRLQLLNDNYGLDLTFATLASMMKYPTPSTQIDDSHVALKKHGFFASEREIVEQVWRRTGLKQGQRHPLAYVMEACDDIAYAVMDVEDTVKKGLASFSDLIAYLKHECCDDPLVHRLVNEAEQKHQIYRKDYKLSPAELNDVSMQRFRVYAIGAMITAAIEAFKAEQETFVSGSQERDLLKTSEARGLRRALGSFAKVHAFRHRSVLEVELMGHDTIRDLMSYFWPAVNETSPDNPEPKSPLNRYVFSRISENYRRVYSTPSKDVTHLPVWYRRCLLMTDMVAGMTDTFAVDILKDFRRFSPPQL